ncbi:o-succinylbenzoate synthase [Carboxylicivirga taeanensis]|uniref:o-succinylbenzoate synthase n=1 Tax=Carboxylicivirga taeanensis TaxID=1416875 RepID=UPI003F6E25DA
MMKAWLKKQNMMFKEAGGTSRGILTSKPSWFIKVQDADGAVGIGECSIIPGLSIDDTPELENKIKQVCQNINDYVTNYHSTLKDFPALRFALETAFMGIEQGHPFELSQGEFCKGNQPIIINGLIWMGNANTMLSRIEEKLQSGFSCLKLKVGAIDFARELELLKFIRERYSENELELRVDANGAFSPGEALSKLDALAKFKLHSIEQPIKAGQHEAMYQLCRQTPLAIALDEELIGLHSTQAKAALINDIQPQYIILKPSLVGGLKAADEWITVAEDNNIQWWATSALEANVGLNAIAHWVATKDNPLRQGLGTGQVFSNNVLSPLYLKGEGLYYDPNKCWDTIFNDHEDEL